MENFETTLTRLPGPQDITRAQCWAAFLIVTVSVLSGVLVYPTIRKSCCGEDLTPAQLRQLEQAGAGGNVSAMKRLYFFYDQGEEPAKARIWLEKAADHADGEAEMLLYDIHFNSSDVREPRLGVQYLIRAAKHGSSTAQQVLGESYRDGEGVAKDMSSAMFWLREGAASSDPDSVLALCDLALQQHDTRQCEECLDLEINAIRSLRAGSDQAQELSRQRSRVQQALNR